MAMGKRIISISSPASHLFWREARLLPLGRSWVGCQRLTQLTPLPHYHSRSWHGFGLPDQHIRVSGSSKTKTYGKDARVRESQSQSFLGVWLGSTLGMVVADGLAIIVGKVLGKRLPETLIT